MKLVLISTSILFSCAAFDCIDAWWKPTPDTSYQIQLSGTLDTSYDVDMYDIDMFDTPNETIAELQQRGIKVICYFSAGTYEDWRSDKDRYSSDIIGAPLPEWEGESWVDIRSTKLREILVDRMQLAQAKGCDGVDPDNVDGAFNDNGFNLTADDQLDFNTFLATTAHGLNLTVGLKNDLNQVDDLVSVFDFSVNEQCVHYNECDMLVPFIKANKPVFGIEYSGDKATGCAIANSLNFDTLFKALSLKSERYSCRDVSGGVATSAPPVTGTSSTGSMDPASDSGSAHQAATHVSNFESSSGSGEHSESASSDSTMNHPTVGASKDVGDEAGSSGTSIPMSEGCKTKSFYS